MCQFVLFFQYLQNDKIDKVRESFLANMSLPNYSTFVCKCFEYLVKDAKEKFSEEYFSYWINLLMFSNGQTVIFLFALTHSKQLQISLNASSLLRLKLCQLTGENDFRNVADDILISFAQLILSSEVAYIN